MNFLQALASKQGEHEDAAWAKREGEPSDAWAGFMVWRDLSPHERKARTVGQTMGLSTRKVTSWAEAHDWHERVAAWDAYLDQIRTRHAANRVVAMQERHLFQAMMMQAKGMERIVEIDAHELSPNDARNLVKDGIQLERITMGEPDSIHQHDMNSDQSDTNARERLARLDQGDREKLAIIIQKSREPK